MPLSEKKLIAINVTRGEAENFIRRMDEQGYSNAWQHMRDGSIEVDFTDRQSGEVSQDYDLIMWDDEAFISFRPL